VRKEVGCRQYLIEKARAPWAGEDDAVLHAESLSETLKWSAAVAKVWPHESDVPLGRFGHPPQKNVEALVPEVDAANIDKQGNLRAQPELSAKCGGIGV